MPALLSEPQEFPVAAQVRYNSFGYSQVPLVFGKQKYTKEDLFFHLSSDFVKAGALKGC